MSFWMGILLNGQAIAAIDQFHYFPAEGDQKAKAFGLPPLPWWCRVRYEQKFLKINDQCFFLPAGSTQPSHKLFEILKFRFGDKLSVSPEDLKAFQSEFQKKASLTWEHLKEKCAAVYQELGIGIPQGVDYLLAGISGSNPFLVNICDVHGFSFRIWDSPGQWFSLIQTEKVNKEIGGRVRAFLMAAMGKGEAEQREIAKKTFRNLFLWLIRQNKYISRSFDLIFIGGNTEVWHCSLILGRYKLRWQNQIRREELRNSG